MLKQTRLFSWLKQRFIRAYLNLTWSARTLNEDALSEEQKIGIRLIKTLSSKPDSEILMAPISDRYYIKRGDIFVTISRDRVSIINSVYHYDIIYSEKAYGSIVGFIRRVIENRRMKLEATMTNKIERSLSHIYRQVQEN